MRRESAVWTQRLRVSKLCGPLIQKGPHAGSTRCKREPRLCWRYPVACRLRSPLVASKRAIACTKWTTRPISLLCYTNLLNTRRAWLRMEAVAPGDVGPPARRKERQCLGKAKESCVIAGFPAIVEQRASTIAVGALWLSRVWLFDASSAKRVGREPGCDARKRAQPRNSRRLHAQPSPDRRSRASPRRHQRSPRPIDDPLHAAAR